jgi:hypothetical protein
VEEKAEDQDGLKLTEAVRTLTELLEQAASAAR